MNFAEGYRGQADERQALFGGAGSVRVWDLLGAMGAPPFSAVLYCELSAAGGVGQHRQLADHEIVLALEGEADVTVDHRVQCIGPGQLVYLPVGAVLAIQNRSNEAVFRYLIIKAKPPEQGTGPAHHG